MEGHDNGRTPPVLGYPCPDCGWPTVEGGCLECDDDGEVG